MGKKVVPAPPNTTFNFEFHCPGCKQTHGFRTPDHPEPAGLEAAESERFKKSKWQWNGDPYSPSIQPSIHIHTVKNGQRISACHSFVTAGHIQFLGDCLHDLAGQTVEIPDYQD